jgi:hypothetical protein
VRKRTFGFARAVRHHDVPPGIRRRCRRPQRLTHGADLIDFQEQGIAGLLLHSASDAGWIGHGQIVAHDLDGRAHERSERCEAVPVVLVKAVFDAHDRKLAAELLHAQACNRKFTAHQSQRKTPFGPVALAFKPAKGVWSQAGST